MLVTRHSDTEQNHWTFPKPSSPPRMSTNYDPPLSTQADWPGQFPSFLAPGDNIFGPSYDHGSSSNSSAPAPAQPRPVGGTEPSSLEIDSSNTKQEPGTNSLSSPLPLPLSHRRSIDVLGLRQQKPPSPIPEQQQQQPPSENVYSHKPAADSVHEESLVSTDAPGMSMGSNQLSSVSSGGQGQDIAPGHTGNNEDQVVVPKEEEDDGLEDEDMLEGDEGAPGGDGSQPQTAAERTAQRRKMKRFRLTHQQTRFLMSEFAKQPHPDAAHRERLSREIPGLSPRQVQVWFQNRRAKIKRLTADDRDRMIKMRAVPDDFDNVQALHSPYGAVHGLGTPISSPVDFSSSSYAEHMMRPLMVDVRRPDGDDHLSPTGLSPAFGGIGFNPSANLNTPDILSPLSPASSDHRYGSSYSHLSSPLGGPRTSNPFARQNSLDTGMQMHGRQGQVRTLQPLQLRETMSRSRSDNLQSPLRSSMSWNKDSIDYHTYHQGHGAAGTPSPQLGSRQQSLYQSADSINSTATTLGGYEPSTYSGSTVQSPTHMNYSSFQSTSLQPGANRNPRLRAASAATGLPLNLNLDHRATQFRSSAVGPAQPLQPSLSATSSATAHSPGIPGAIGGGPRSASHQHHHHHLSVSSTSYTASFPSAPLTAPIDFHLPRTPGGGGGGFRSASASDYSMPQMSAPIAPPGDFSQAFQASMAAASSSTAGATRTPMRDSFGSGISGPTSSSTTTGGPVSATSGTGPVTSSGTSTGSTDLLQHHHRNDDYGGHHSSHHHDGGLGVGSLKRKLSFTLPHQAGGSGSSTGGGGPGAGPGGSSYGSSNL